MQGASVRIWQTPRLRRAPSCNVGDAAVARLPWLSALSQFASNHPGAAIAVLTPDSSSVACATASSPGSAANARLVFAANIADSRIRSYPTAAVALELTVDRADFGDSLVPRPRTSATSGNVAPGCTRRVARQPSLHVRHGGWRETFAYRSQWRTTTNPRTDIANGCVVTEFTRTTHHSTMLARGRRERTHGYRTGGTGTTLSEYCHSNV